MASASRAPMPAHLNRSEPPRQLSGRGLAAPSVRRSRSPDPSLPEEEREGRADEGEDADPAEVVEIGEEGRLLDQGPVQDAEGGGAGGDGAELAGERRRHLVEPRPVRRLV